jgi:hypothetical protein
LEDKNRFTDSEQCELLVRIKNIETMLATTEEKQNSKNNVIWWTVFLYWLYITSAFSLKAL